MEKLFYTYVLMDPRKPGPFTYVLADGTEVRFTCEPFYVGKGKGGRSRAHLNVTDRDDSFKARKIRSILRAGFDLKIRHSKRMFTEDQAFAYERELIAAIGRHGITSGPLTNRCDGGEGSSGHHRSKSAVEQQRAAIKAYWDSLSQEEREALGKKSSKGVKAWWDSASPEQRLARSESSRRGTLRSLESLTDKERELRFANVRKAARARAGTVEAKQAALIGAEGLKAFYASMSEHEYAAWIERRAAKRRDRSSEAKKATADKFRSTLATLPPMCCPHCKYESRNRGSMTRWHFDNCKERQ